MSGDSCSGSNPLKGLLKQQETPTQHDRLAALSAPSYTAFRPTSNHTQGQRGFLEFVGEDHPIPALNSGVLPHMKSRPLQNFSPVVDNQAPRHDAWTDEYTRFTTTGLQRSRFTSHEPASPNTTMVAYSHAQQTSRATEPNTVSPYPAIGLFKPPTMIAQYPPGQEIHDWMNTHIPQKRVFDDVDAALQELSRELGDVTVEAQTCGGSSQPGHAEQASIDVHEHEPTSSLSQPGGESSQHCINSESSVSQAAKRILDTVDHEDGTKWKESTFLALMRDFRDGKKDIVENEVRTTRLQND